MRAHGFRPAFFPHWRLLRAKTGAESGKTAKKTPLQPGSGAGKFQFFSACSGAGMRPPRLTNTDGENVFTDRMGA